jgi:hypothetical protein
MEESDELELIWNDLKKHILPPEVPIYAKKIGLARIQRNEETFNELRTLRKIHNNIQNELAEEIEKKTPAILVSAQRTATIQKCVNFLNSLKAQGHFIETDNPVDREIIKFLNLTRQDMPSSTSSTPITRPSSQLRSSRSSPGFENSIEDVQLLLDDEFENLQTQIQVLRHKMFNDCDELQTAKSIETPTTESIEKFNKRLQQQDFTLKSMAKMSSANRLRESVKMNRLWE